MNESPKYTLILRGIDYATAREVADKAAGDSLMWSDGKAYPSSVEEPWEMIREGEQQPTAPTAQPVVDEPVGRVSLSPKPDVLGSRVLFWQAKDALAALPAGKYDLFVRPQPAVKESLTGAVPEGWLRTAEAGNPPDGLYVAIMRDGENFTVGLVEFGKYDFFDGEGDHPEAEDDGMVHGYGWSESVEARGETVVYVRNVVAYLPTNYSIDVEAMKAIRQTLTASTSPVEKQG